LMAVLMIRSELMVVRMSSEMGLRRLLLVDILIVIFSGGEE
jgi:hypothetical protein